MGKDEGETVKVSDLEKGDLIKSNWLGEYKGSEWHEIYEKYPSSSDEDTVRINIEGYGSVELDKDDTIERK